MLIIPRSRIHRRKVLEASPASSGIPFDVTDLALWLEFEEDGVGDLLPVDRSSYEHSITQVNSPTVVDSGFPGIKAARNVGSSRLTTLEHSAFNATNEFSLFGWIRMPEARTTVFLNSMWGQMELSYASSNDTILARVWTNPGAVQTNIPGNIALPVGDWSLLGSTFKAGGKIKVYLGSQLLAITDAATVTSCVTPTRLAYINHTPSTYKSDLAQCIFYRRTLTDGDITTVGESAPSGSEVANLYNNGTPLMYANIDPQ